MKPRALFEEEVDLGNDSQIPPQCPDTLVDSPGNVAMDPYYFEAWQVCFLV